MLLSREQLDKAAEIHPQVAAAEQYLSKNPSPPVDSRDHVALRTGLAMGTKLLMSRLGPAPPGISESDHTIPMRDGFMSTLKIQRPAQAPAGPLIALFFGGGFVAGDKDQLTLIGRLFVAMFGASVVLVGYRVAPEHKFPVAQLDGWDTMIWAAENATGPLIGADPSKGFIIGGVSAGASIAAALCRKFQEAKLAHPLTGQWLCVPSLMDQNSCPKEYRSHYVAQDQIDKASGLSQESMDMMKRATEWDVNSELRYAALSATPVADQPRTFIQVGGMDPLRDDGLIYEEMLKSAGVATRLDMYEGCPHGHAFSMPGTEIGQRAMMDILVGFGWLLERDVPRTLAAKALGISTA